MPNTHVYNGSDASLVFAVDDNATVEGGLAEGLIEEYELSSAVGRLHDVRIKVVNDLRPYHEIGMRHAAELRPGNIDIHGTARRAFINGALLGLLLGEASASPPGRLAQPAFNIVLQLKSPAFPDVSDKLVLFGVKFDSWTFELSQGEFVMEDVGFRALRIAREQT